MSIAMMVITDAPPGAGKNTPRLDYLRRTLASADRHLFGDVSDRFIVADCAGNTQFLHAVEDAYHWSNKPDGYTVLNYGQRLGFAGAIQAGWAHVRGLPEHVTHVFHLEGDFTFNHNINLDAMAAVLDATPDLAQLALLRQPWNTEEMRAGGIIQLHPEDFYMQAQYVRHSRFWTTNPCMYRRELLERGWPDAPESEGKFGIGLVQAGYHFGFWQESLDAAPAVEHIGRQRSGTGY